MDFLLPEWLLALALTLFVTDLFQQTEILSWWGVLSLSCYLTWRIDAPFKWSVLVFLLSLLLFSALYYFVFRAFVGRAFARLVMKNAPPETVSAIASAAGKIHFAGGKPMFRRDGDDELWPIRNPPADAVEGMPVVAKNLQDGFIILEPLHGRRSRP